MSTVLEPLSPEGKAYVDNYTPSKDDPEVVAFFGRRHMRIANGQDPERHPEKFTPVRENLMHYKWPTDEEAELWAAKVMAGSKQVEPKSKQMLFASCSPSVGSSSNVSPATVAKTGSSSSADDFEAMPMQPLA